MWPALTFWLLRARAVVTESAPALNAMNVFPVSDSDTGSNLELTLAGITEVLPDLDRPAPELDDSAGARCQKDPLDPLIQAAILSAHGNSGAIVAEMVISVCRALRHEQVRLANLAPGALVSRLMRIASSAANRAVARPVAGTILTVADSAADGAEALAADATADALAVARAAQRAARSALARTPEQLPVLAAARVVDAGGQALVLLIDVLVEVLGGDQAQPLPMPVGAMSPPGLQAAEPATEYELMYVLTGATPEGLDQLRGQLSELGNSVVVVGDSAVAQVHVHLTDAGAAIEAALNLGRPTRIRVRALDAVGGSEARTVIALVAGDGIAEAVRAMGGVPISASGDEDLLDELSKAVEGAKGGIVLLPNGLLSVETVRALLANAGCGRRVAVISTPAQTQGLAALAVHEPTTDFDSAVIAMSTAAGHARYAGVTIAQGPEMTAGGPCRRGDVLGMLEGDIVEIGDSVTEVGWRVISRLLASGGELLTLISGANADPEVVEELASRARKAKDGLDLEILHGGQRPYLLLIGLE